MFAVFVNGLVSGIWFLGAALPSLLLLLLAMWAYGRAKKRDEVTFEGFMEDFPPDIPTSEPEQEHRFVASTIVRPPDVMKRKENEDDDDKS